MLAIFARRIGAAFTLGPYILAASAQSLPDPQWSLVEPDYGARALALSPDGELIATAGASPHLAIKLWRTADASLVANLEGHTNGITGLAFSPDGTVLASIGRDEVIRLWSLAEESEFATLPNAGGRFHPYGRVAFSPDGTLIAGSSTEVKTLGIWRASDRSLLHELEAHEGGVNTVAFSPNGQLLAAGGGYRGLDTSAKIYDPATGELIKTLETSNTYGIEQVLFSPNGRILAIGTSHLTNFEGQVELWDTETWQLLHRLPSHGYLLAFSPDGNVLISVIYLTAAGARNQVDFWNTQTGARLASFSAPSPEFGVLRGMEVHPDGSRLILAGELYDGTLWTTHLKVIPMPLFLLLASHPEPGFIRFESTAPSAVLQVKTNLDSDWLDVEPINNGITFPSTHPAAFFRTKVPE